MDAVAGGALIGLAASLLLVANGKIAGVSGILGGTLSAQRGEFWWRLSFLTGLIFGGFILQVFAPEVLRVAGPALPWDYIAGGLLVGIGTLLGNGCTSGHGVCGISRFSPRSLVATCTFIAFGVVSSKIFDWFHGPL